MEARSSIAERCLRALGTLLARPLYRVSTYDEHRLPAGGFLLLPNHLTWVDAIVLQVGCPRPIRFMVSEDIYRLRWLKPIFRIVRAIPISPRHAKEAMRAAVEQIQSGEVVCIFPEGELSRSGILLRLRRGYEVIARTAECPVVPVWLDQLWGSIFSYAGGRYFFKWPRKIPYPVTIAYGEAIPGSQADIATVRQKFLELGEFCFQQRPHLRGHLGRASLHGLRRRQFETAVIDGADGSRLSRGSVLAAASALSQWIREECPNPRVAIVLPPGKGGLIANLAVLLADKVPVNLNFTAGRAALEAAIGIGAIRDCLTARPLAQRLTTFPWPEHTVAIDELLPGLKPQILLWRALVAILPAVLLARMLQIPETGDSAEGFLLFTSGSSGAPKGVALTHRNLLANVTQFALMLNLDRSDAVLGCLPIFHSFGASVTVLFPMIEGVRLVTYPNPLETAKIANLVHSQGVTLFLTTPTFLRGYLRKADPAQLASVKLLVTGAEKLPQELADAFQARFGLKVLQGYGLTETSPVVSVNLPEPVAELAPFGQSSALKEDGGTPDARISAPPARVSVQPSSRDGSVGKLAPGIAARIREPESGAALSLHETGMLWLRGANVFEGYLSDPARTAEVLQDGWFKTGDLGRFDEDGFLYIEGRLSRFSKIAGEMVPHETVEHRIAELLGVAHEAERVCAIVGIPDSVKGEALVLLATRPIDLADLRSKLSDAGLPNLWIPKKTELVESIPVLASGKLDLARCKELAQTSNSET